MIEVGAHLVGQAFGIALGCTFPGEFFQCLLRGEIRKELFLRILIGEFREREPAAVHDLGRAGERFRVAVEQAVHLFGRLQIPIGETLAAMTEFIDGDIVPDGGDEILHHLPVYRVEQNVIGDDRRNPGCGSEVRQLPEAELIVRPPSQCQRQIGAIPESLPQTSQMHGAVIIGAIRYQDGDQSFAIGHEIGPFEVALSFAGPLLAERQQAAKPGIGRPVGWIDEDRQAVGKVEAAADHQPDTTLS